jgi:hypothetical protein
MRPRLSYQQKRRHAIFPIRWLFTPQTALQGRIE